MAPRGNIYSLTSNIYSLYNISGSSRGRFWDDRRNIPNQIPIATLAPIIQMGPHAQDSLVHYLPRVHRCVVDPTLSQER